MGDQFDLILEQLRETRLMIEKLSAKMDDFVGSHSETIRDVALIKQKCDAECKSKEDRFTRIEGRIFTIETKQAMQLKDVVGWVGSIAGTLLSIIAVAKAFGWF